MNKLGLAINGFMGSGGKFGTPGEFLKFALNEDSTMDVNVVLGCIDENLIQLYKI